MFLPHESAVCEDWSWLGKNADQKNIEIALITTEMNSQNADINANENRTNHEVIRSQWQWSSDKSRLMFVQTANDLVPGELDVPMFGPIGAITVINEEGELCQMAHTNNYISTVIPLLGKEKTILNPALGGEEIISSDISVINNINQFIKSTNKYGIEGL